MNRSRRGFTLIELLIVVAIMAIIAAVAVPAIVGASGDAGDDTRGAEANNCYNKVVEAIQWASKDAVVNKANVLANLNKGYAGATLIKSVKISEDDSGMYTILVTDEVDKEYSKTLGGVTWINTEVKYDASNPLTVTLTMGSDGFWS